MYVFLWHTQIYYFKHILRHILVNLFTCATSIPNKMKRTPKTPRRFVSPFLLIPFPYLSLSHMLYFWSGMFSQGLVPIFGLLRDSGSFEMWGLVERRFIGEFSKEVVRYSFSLFYSWLHGKLEVCCALCPSCGVVLPPDRPQWFTLPWTEPSMSMSNNKLFLLISWLSELLVTVTEGKHTRLSVFHKSSIRNCPFAFFLYRLHFPTSVAAKID